VEISEARELESCLLSRGCPNGFRVGAAAAPAANGGNTVIGRTRQYDEQRFWVRVERAGRGCFSKWISSWLLPASEDAMWARRRTRSRPTRAADLGAMALRAPPRGLWRALQFTRRLLGAASYFLVAPNLAAGVVSRL
jgi:hypothetical protein